MPQEITINNLLPARQVCNLARNENGLQNTTFVGIDFGTSTTVVSIARTNGPGEKIHAEFIELNQKFADGTIQSDYKIPTTIAWHNNQPLFGEGAKELKFKLTKNKDLWHSFKMDLGTDIGCMYPNSVMSKESHFPILNPVDVTTLFFKYLKAQIERYVGEKFGANQIQYAVSIPASFEANQRRDLLKALENNDIQMNKQSFIDEPNAAFLSYIFHSELENQTLRIPEDYNANILVFDFGAGTCDLSILEIGQDNNGTYSKNVAISKFDKLGGDNIDQLIAVDILMPKLFENSEYTTSDFRTREIKESIIPKLTATAERLKIMVCEAISLTLNEDSDVLKDQITFEKTITRSLTIDSTKGMLTLDNPSLTFQDLKKIMTVFCAEFSTLPAKRIEKELEFISIFNPIKSVLKKATLKPESIDYVLFIGGSCKNPFIQKVVSNYFKESVILIPKDLQAHVSIGAAIHSLIFNGFGKNLIQPITSEPILLITKDGRREVGEPILSAGTVIPTETQSLTTLRPQMDGQMVIEMPICVGNFQKMLFNIRLFSTRGFNRTDEIKLEYRIDADKMLIIRASSGTNVIHVEPLSPFVNKEMSGEERVQFKAEREYNLAVEKNGGIPTKVALDALYKVYCQIGFEFKAAETLEEINERFGSANLNNLGLHYSNAGKKDKAIHFYQLDLEKKPSSTVAFNIAMLQKSHDRIAYKKHLEMAYELDKEHNPTCYSLALEYKKDGKREEANKLLEESFSRWQRKFDENTMSSSDYSWFSSCAQELGKKDLAQHIRDSEPTKKVEGLFDPQNLATIEGGEQIDTKKLID